MPPTDPIRRSDRRKAYLIGHPFLLACGASGAVAGPLFFLMPGSLSTAALGMALPGLIERLWALTFAIGGGAVLAGMFRLDARWEVAGLLALCATYVCQAYAAVEVRGTSGLVIVGLMSGPALGTLARAYILTYEPESAPWQGRRS